MQKLQFCALYISAPAGIAYTSQRGTTSRKYTKRIIKLAFLFIYLFFVNLLLESDMTVQAATIVPKTLPY